MFGKVCNTHFTYIFTFAISGEKVDDTGENLNFLRVTSYNPGCWNAFRPVTKDPQAWRPSVPRKSKWKSFLIYLFCKSNSQRPRRARVTADWCQIIGQRVRSAGKRRIPRCSVATLLVVKFRVGKLNLCKFTCYKSGKLAKVLLLGPGDYCIVINHSPTLEYHV